MKRRGRKGTPGPKKRLLLDHASVNAVERGNKLGAEFARLNWDHYSALAYQRSNAAEEIAQALLGAAVPYEFRRWQRVIRYRHALSPLSSAGSISDQVGGRFNIGQIDPIKFNPFSALYIAEDKTTACHEKYGTADAGTEGLTPLELALQDPSSIAYVAVNGKLNTVIDLGDLDRLAAFVEIIRNFSVPPGLAARARSLNVPPIRVVRSIEELMIGMYDPTWRASAVVADVPAASQIFGQLAANAGIEAILYQSIRSPEPKGCLAVFDRNLGGDSYVELADTPPPGVVARLPIRAAA